MEQNILNDTYLVEGFPKRVAEKIASLYDRGYISWYSSSGNLRLALAGVLGVSPPDISQMYFVYNPGNESLYTHQLWSQLNPLYGVAAAVIGYSSKPNVSYVIPKGDSLDKEAFESLELKLIQE